MTISDGNRQILIDHRLKKADELSSEIQIHINNGHYNTAVNRIYYSLFYALSALALKKAFTTTKHQQLIGWFNRDFIKEKLIDQKYGKILNTAFEMRTKGDYDDFIKYDKIEVEKIFEEMKDFILMIKRLLDK
jgi:uncharacterized protein (UPF0332 family)